MVAIVAGQGLGLQNTSKELLGGGGVLGNAGQGVTGEKVYVNASTGNLVVSQQDEWLVGLGPDAGILRTYNSLGDGTDDNGDNWRLGLSRRIGVVGGGALEAAGSYVERVDEGGDPIRYNWDAVRKAYVSKSGSGAYDTLKYSASTAQRPYAGWTWTDGDTQQVEHYEGTSAAGAKLKSVVNLDGHRIDLTYDTTRPNLITKILTTTGISVSDMGVGVEEVEITYQAGTNNIESMLTRYQGGTPGVPLKRVTYGYDGSNRLASVKVDLTLDDLQDSKSIETKYTYYDGTKRLATLEQLSGTTSLSKLEFTYVSASDGRLKSIKERVNAQDLVTEFDYSTAGLTKVKDALGQYTEIAYNDPGSTTAADKKQQLKSIKLPTATQALVSYEYDDSGNVTKVTDGRGNETIYRYDSQGNRVYERNAEGNVIERSYGSANQLLSETVYAVSDPDGTGAQLAGKPQTTHYVYDAKLHLRYVVNPLGQVTEHRYNDLGLRTGTLQYAQGSFSVSALTETGQNFNTNTDGWSGVSGAFQRVGDALQVTSKQQASESWTLAGTTQALPMGTSWSIDFTTPSLSTTKTPVNFGISSGTPGQASYRQYRLLINNGLMSVYGVVGTSAVGGMLGAVKASTNYVLEIVTQADGGTQLYVYEKGQERSSGFTDTRNLGGWGDAKFQIEAFSGAQAATPSTPGSSVAYVFDNLSTKLQPGLTELNAWVAEQTDKSTVQRTDYGYDTRGNLASKSTYAQVYVFGEGVQDGVHDSLVDYIYDQAGNLLNTLTWVSGEFNYTSHVYDGLNRLTAQTDEASRETKTEYLDASRQVKVTSANGLVTTSTYDEAGRLLTVSRGEGSALASLGTTSYTYDKLGRLIATQLPSGQKSHIVYDAQGRKVADVDAEFGLTEYRYNAAGQLAHTIRYSDGVTAAGQATLLAGDAVTVASLRTSNTNDRHTLYVYDAAGRLAKTITPHGAGYGQGALLDASVQELVYDGAGQLIETIQYATQVDSTQASQLASNALTLKSAAGQIIAGGAVITLGRDEANDRHVRQFYDAAGRLVGKLDGENYYTAYAYDGAGRLVRTSRYATAMAGSLVNAQTPPQVIASSASAPSQGAYVRELSTGTYLPGGRDQHTYRIYNARGQVSAEIDAEGYVTSYDYDGRANLTVQKRYANKALLANEAGAVLLGQVLETTGNWVARYVKGASAGASDHTTTHRYDELNRVVRTESQPQGLVTTYGYDAKSGDLVKVVTGVGSGAALERTQLKRFDKLGRVTGELNAEGAKALAALGASPSPEQVDSIWKQYGVLHEYDLSGNRTATTTPDGQGEGGLKTVYYYDRNGRLTHSINALGEVSSFVYNQFGELTDERRHAARLNGVSGLAGGVSSSMSDEIRTALSDLVDESLDRHTKNYYDRSGRIYYTGDAATSEGSSLRYNAFGELYSTERFGYTENDYFNRYTLNFRDRRGLITQTADTDSDATQDLRSTFKSYDAFGRLTISTDGRELSTTYLYDRLGRQIRVMEPHEPIFSTLRTSYSYDAFDRVVALVEPSGAKTTFVYDDVQRTLTKRVPLDWQATGGDYIETVTKQDVHGQTVEIKDGRGYRRQFEYDLNGQLTKQTLLDASGGVVPLDGEYQSNEYDKAGRLIVSWDKNQKVEIAYDKANRVVTRTVDPEGENLTSEYRYDALGQAVWTRDAAGVWTHTEYNQQGRVERVTIDPTQVPKASEVGSQASASNVFALQANPKGADAVNQVTLFQYSVTGELVRMTKGQGSESETIEYAYDELGRRVAEIKDPDGLALRTRYTYDKNNNVVARTDALGHVTRYIYDRSNRVAFEIDAMGAVVRYDHDESGNVSRRVAHQSRVSLTGLALEVDQATILALLPAQPQAGDQVSYQFYDAANRLTMSIDAVGSVTRRIYDKSGNVAKLIRYANAAINLDATGMATGDRLSFTEPTMLEADEGALIDPSDPLPRVVSSTLDQIEQFAYDGANRLTWKVDALGYATNYAYSGHGSEVIETRYANAVKYPADSAGLAVGGSPQVVAQAPANPTGAYIVQDGDKDLDSARAYDNTGRLQVKRDALGYLTYYVYDGAGRVTQEQRHVEPYTLDETTAAITSYAYDGAGNLIEVTDAEGNKTRHVYDAAGNRIETTVAHGTTDASKTTYTYDDAGRLTAETRAKGTDEEASTSYVLDALGQRKEIIDARGYYTLQDFDAVGRIKQVTDPLGGKTITEYDAFGNAVKVTDPNGNAGYFFFDQNNRNTWQIDPTGYAVQTERDAFGNATRIVRYYQVTQGTIKAGQAPMLFAIEPSPPPVDAYIVKSSGKDSGHGVSYGGDAETLIEYDKLNRQVSITDAVGNIERMTYGDAFGNKTSVTNKMGGVTQMTYDKLNRLSSETQSEKAKALDEDGRVLLNSSGAPLLQTVETRYAYDSRGNQTKKIEAHGLSEQRITEYAYDKVNRLITSTREAMPAYTTERGHFTEAPIESRKYDARGNLIEQTDSSGSRTLIWWDALNRKVAELKATGVNATAQMVGSLSSYEYDEAGNLSTQRAWGTSVVMPTAWTPAGVAEPTGTDVRETQYEYDANQRLISSTIENVVVGEIDATSGSFNLNPADLVKRTEYDASGNAIVETDARGAKTYHYYNALGQLIATVDAERYATFWVRDASGNVTSELKNARQLPESYTLTAFSDVQALSDLTSSSLDRGTLYYRDRLGRVLVQTAIETAVYNPSATDEASRYVAAPAGSYPVTKFEYNGLGQVTKKTEATGEALEWTYDTLGREISRKSAVFADHTGTNVRMITDTEYNALGDVMRTIQRGAEAASEADDRISTYQYGKNGLLTRKVDASGAVTIYEHDLAGRVTRTRNPRLDGTDALNRTANVAPGRLYIERTLEAEPDGAVDRKFNLPLQGIAFEPGFVFSTELTTGANSSGRYFKIGIGSGADGVDYHTARFWYDTVFVEGYPATGYPRSGNFTVKNNTTYVVEFHAELSNQNDGTYVSTLRIYEKGLPNDSGLISFASRGIFSHYPTAWANLAVRVSASPATLGSASSAGMGVADSLDQMVITSPQGQRTEQSFSAWANSEQFMSHSGSQNHNLLVVDALGESRRSISDIEELTYDRAGQEVRRHAYTNKPDKYVIEGMYGNGALVIGRGSSPANVVSGLLAGQVSSDLTLTAILKTSSSSAGRKLALGVDARAIIDPDRAYQPERGPSTNPVSYELFIDGNQAFVRYKNVDGVQATTALAVVEANTSYQVELKFVSFSEYSSEARYYIYKTGSAKPASPTLTLALNRPLYSAKLMVSQEATTTKSTAFDLLDDIQVSVAGNVVLSDTFAQRTGAIGQLAYSQTGHIWVQDDAGASTGTNGTIQEVKYNAYGEVVAKGKDGAWQESAQFDAAGRVVRSIGSDGVPKIYVYDANGNITVTLRPPANGLTSTFVKQIFMGTGPVTAGDIKTLLENSSGVVLSSYDARGKLTDTYEASASKLFAATNKVSATVGSVTAEEVKNYPPSSTVATGKAVGVSFTYSTYIYSNWTGGGSGNDKTIRSISDTVKVEITPTGVVGQKYHVVIDISDGQRPRKGYGYVQGTHQVMDLEEGPGGVLVTKSITFTRDVIGNGSKGYKSDYGDVSGASILLKVYKVIDGTSGTNSQLIATLSGESPRTGLPPDRVVVGYKQVTDRSGNTYFMPITQRRDNLTISTSGGYTTPDEKSFTISSAPAGTTHAVLQYRMKASGQVAWRVASIPINADNKAIFKDDLLAALGPALIGTTESDLEYVLSTVDATGSVLSVQTGEVGVHRDAAAANYYYGMIVKAPVTQEDRTGRLFTTTEGITFAVATQDAAEQASQPKSALVRYRKVGESAWSNTQVAVFATAAGAAHPGWFVLPQPGAFVAGATYEYQVDLFAEANGQGANLGAYLGYMQGAASGGQVYTGEPPVKAERSPSIVRFHGVPTEATTATVQYSLTKRVLTDTDGAPLPSGRWVTEGQGEIPLTQGADGNFVWDAAVVALDPTLQYMLDYTFTAKDSSGATVGSMTSREGLFTGNAANKPVFDAVIYSPSASSTQYYRVSGTQLKLTHSDAIASQVRKVTLAYRPTGSSGAYTKIVQNPTPDVTGRVNEVTFDLSALLASGASFADYDVYYRYENASGQQLLQHSSRGPDFIFRAQSATVVSGGPGIGSISSTFNGSGLRTWYTSGQTSFDTYIAGKPLHSRDFNVVDGMHTSYNEWFADSGTTTAAVSYDLGSIQVTQGLALWNEDSNGVGKLNILGSVDGQNWVTLGSNLSPTNNPEGVDYGADVFRWTPTSARYLKLELSQPPSSSAWVGASLGEVAFNVEGDLDPVRLRLLPESSTPATGIDAAGVLWGFASDPNTSHRKQVYNAFGEVARELTAVNQDRAIQKMLELGRPLTDEEFAPFASWMHYDGMGRLIAKADPQTSATLENGMQVREAPVTRYEYDALGRLTKVTDSRGNVTSYELLKTGDNRSLVTKEFRPDDTGQAYVAIQNGYDIFGDLRTKSTPLTSTTRAVTDYVYDKMGRLTRVDMPTRSDGKRATHLYSYDSRGNRVLHRTSPTDVINASGGLGTNQIAEYTLFDAQGRVRQTISGEGLTTSTYYGVGPNGQTVKVFTDENGKQLRDWLDQAGRVLRHVDMSGNIYQYDYNLAGNLLAQYLADANGNRNGRGQYITYSYFADGTLKGITDHALNAESRFEYDKDGHRTYESYTVAGTNLQTTTIRYDELGRISYVEDPRYYRMTYEYDEVGNRRRVFGELLGVNSTSTWTSRMDYWYTYDQQNRLTVSMGHLQDGRATDRSAASRISQGTSGRGVRLGYDLAGNRASALYAGETNAELYSYTADGYLTTATKAGATLGERTNDLLGRVTQYVQNSDGVTTTETRQYDQDNRTTYTKTITTKADGANSETWNYYTQISTGVKTSLLISSKTISTPKSGSAATTTYNRYDYIYRDSALQSAIKTGASNPGVDSSWGVWASGISQFTYNVNGHVSSVKDSRDGGNVDVRNISFTVNANGQILQRNESGPYPVIPFQRYFYVDGQRVIEWGNTENPNSISYADALAPLPSDQSNPRNRYRNLGPIRADVDQNYTPISASYPAFTPGGYTVRLGDTLQSIARAVWGDAAMWYLLAEANGMRGNEDLRVGQLLVVPNKVTNFHNTSQTQRVYNPGEVMGDVSPTLPDAPVAPPPPSKGGCGAVGMVLMIVVAIALAAVVGPAVVGMLSSYATVGAALASGSLAGVAAGLAGVAAGAAVGSIGSQLVGMATGDVQKFSWSAVSRAAVSAVVTAAIPMPQIGGWQGAMASAAVANVGSQGLAMLTGKQSRFNWTAVAASAAGGLAAYGAGAAMNKMDVSFGSDTATQIGRQTIQGMAAGAASALIHQEKPQWSAIAVQSFGSALGDAVVGKIAQVQHERAQAKLNAEIDGYLEGVLDGPEGNPQALSLPPAASANPASPGVASPGNSGVPILADEFASPERSGLYKVRSGDTLTSITGGDKVMMGRYISGSKLQDPNKIRSDQTLSPNWDMSDEEAIALADRFYAADGKSKVLAAQRAAAARAGAYEYMLDGYDPLQPFDSTSFAGRVLAGSGQRAQGISAVPRAAIAPSGAANAPGEVLTGPGSFASEQERAVFAAGTLVVLGGTALLLEAGPVVVATSAQLIRNVALSGSLTTGLSATYLANAGSINALASNATTLVLESATGATSPGSWSGSFGAKVATSGSVYGPARAGLEIPQGISPLQFDRISGRVRGAADAMGLGDDIFVMGSRSGGTAKASSDLDIGIRVSPERFDELIGTSFGNAKNANARTMEVAIRDGRIQAGEVGLSRLGRLVAKDLSIQPKKVQISVISAGGVFDNGPQSKLSYNF